MSTTQEYLCVISDLTDECNDLRAALAAAEQGRDALQAKITVLEGHAHAGLLEAFDAYARQFTYNSHPAKPEHFPKSFIWFSAGYSAAGAAPVPEGWQIVPVEALTRWRDAFSEELSAWDIDPPLHHIQTSHDEISAILSSAPKEPT